MADDAIIVKVRQDTPESPEYLFFCPGCQYSHWFKTTGGKPFWLWNADYTKPTVRPSIVSAPNTARQCHLWITDGTIEFLLDSWHRLRGQSGIPMEPV